MKKAIAVLLVVLTLVSLLSVSASARPAYRLDGLSKEYAALMESGGEEYYLGCISAKYECGKAQGDPGAISEVSGDAGGVSYGAFMFASKSGVPLAFAKWCISSGEGILTGTRLVSAYELDGKKYGENFNAEWKKIAQEDAQGFLKLQRDYVKIKYYDVMVDRLRQRYADFDVENYTLAFKNVILSRAVQNGVNSNVIINGVDKIGGFAGHTEEELIRAVYAESACVVAQKPNENSYVIQASSAEKYGMDKSLLTGRYLRYFSLNSSDIQVSVFRRLTVYEPKDVFEMYTYYTGQTVQNTTVTPNVDLSGGSTLPQDPADPGTGDDTVSNIITVLKGTFEVIKLVFNVFVKLYKLISSWIKSMN